MNTQITVVIAEPGAYEGKCTITIDAAELADATAEEIAKILRKAFNGATEEFLEKNA